MAKAKTADNKSPKDSAAKAPTLAGLRGQVDHIDRELVGLINQRAKLAHKIGQIKDTAGQPTYDPIREEEVLARTSLFNKGPLCDANLRAVFREIISGSRALEKKMRVAYLGPAYSYTHLAAIHRFGQALELVGVGTIAAVFEEVNRGHADFGLVPIENSTDGRIADTLDTIHPPAGENLRRSATADPSSSVGSLQPAKKCKRSTASRKHYRNAATGLPSIIPRPARSK